MPLIGVLAFIERCEEGVQDTVITLEYLIQQHNVRLWDLARRLNNGFAWTQQRHRFAVGRQLVRGPIKHSKGVLGIFHLPQAIYRTLQIKAQIPVYIVTLQCRVRDTPGDET